MYTWGEHERTRKVKHHSGLAWRRRRGSDRGQVVFAFFFFQAEDGIRDYKVTGVQTCALPILDDLLQMERTTLYRALKILQRKGLVRSRPGKGREQLLVLTKSGVAKHAEAQQIGRASCRERV